MITDEEEIECNSEQGDMSRGRGRGRCVSSRRMDDGARTRQRVRTQEEGKNIIF